MPLSNCGCKTGVVASDDRRVFLKTAARHVASALELSILRIGHAGNDPRYPASQERAGRHLRDRGGGHDPRQGRQGHRQTRPARERFISKDAVSIYIYLAGEAKPDGGRDAAAAVLAVAKKTSVVESKTFAGQTIEVRRTVMAAAQAAAAAPQSGIDQVLASLTAARFFFWATFP